MSFTHWILAARPKTLTGAAMPVLIGGALAYYQQQGLVSRWTWAGCLLFALLMQIDANFINDIFDYLKGTDREDRLGPQRACAQGWITPGQMKVGILIVTLLACAIGLITVSGVWHSLPFGGWEFILLGLLCVLFAFLLDFLGRYT